MANTQFGLLQPGPEHDCSERKYSSKTCELVLLDIHQCVRGDFARRILAIARYSGGAAMIGLQCHRGPDVLEAQRSTGK